MVNSCWFWVVGMSVLLFCGLLFIFLFLKVKIIMFLKWESYITRIDDWYFAEWEANKWKVSGICRLGQKLCISRGDMSKPGWVLLLCLLNIQMYYKALFCLRIFAHVKIHALHCMSHPWRHTHTHTHPANSHSSSSSWLKCHFLPKCKLFQTLFRI